jgi:hypothetical protein
VGLLHSLVFSRRAMPVGILQLDAVTVQSDIIDILSIYWTLRSGEHWAIADH